MIFNPLMKGEPLLEASEKQGLKRNSCHGAEFLQLGSRLQHTARGDVMFWG
jgi:hypothetical protein